jgi:thiopeptide-type bacteriocin biosynthesis protein
MVTHRNLADRPVATEWLFVQLYPGGWELLDSTVLDIVRLAAREALDLGADCWFFLRYTDIRGPHIRLRVRATTDVLNAIHQHWRGAMAPRLEQQAQALRARVPPSLLYAPYEPEVEKYGGRAGVELAEAAFQVSSRAALDLLARCPDRPSRLALASLAVQRHCATVPDVNASRFLDFHRDYWTGVGVPLGRQSPFAASLLVRIEELELQLSREPTISSTLDEIASATAAAIEQAVSISSSVRRYGLLLHHLHMTLNRIGVGPHDELHIAQLVASRMRAITLTTAPRQADHV